MEGRQGKQLDNHAVGSRLQSDDFHLELVVSAPVVAHLSKQQMGLEVALQGPGEAKSPRTSLTVHLAVLGQSRCLLRLHLLSS